MADRFEVEGRRWTGQAVHVHLTTGDELVHAVEEHDPVVASFRDDARRLPGPPIDALLGSAA